MNGFDRILELKQNGATLISRFPEYYGLEIFDVHNPHDKKYMSGLIMELDEDDYLLNSMAVDETGEPMELNITHEENENVPVGKKASVVGVSISGSDLLALHQTGTNSYDVYMNDKQMKKALK